MRRVLMDRWMRENELVTYPDEDGKILGLPEADEDNSGTAFVVGSTNRVQSLQTLLLQVKESGDFLDFGDEGDRGGKFIVAPTIGLLGSGGDVVVDTPHAMGGDLSCIASTAQACRCLSTDNQLKRSIHVKKLEHAEKATETVGYVAMMAYAEFDDATTDCTIIRVWRMPVYVDFYGYANDNGKISYQWDHNGTDISTDDDAAKGAGCDFVELPDGSIVMFVVTGNRSSIWKSFDHGTTWNFITSPIGDWSNKLYNCAIDRIGNRLVLAFAQDDDVDITVCYSDDGGNTWTACTTIVRPAVGECFMSMVHGKDGVLYLTYTSGEIGSQDQNTLSTLDGIIWAAGVKTADGFTSALCQSHVGTWQQYYTESGLGQGVIQHRLCGVSDTPMVNWNEFDVNKFVQMDASFIELSAASLMQDGFIDVAAIANPTGSYYVVMVYRTAMWSGINTGAGWDADWCAAVYPSETNLGALSDPQPRTSEWTKAIANSGATALILGGADTSRISSLRLLNDANKHLTYRIATAADGYTNGVLARFELRVISGIGIVTAYLANGDDSADVFAEVEFGVSNIKVYDYFKAGGAGYITAAQKTPANDWDPADPNEYIVAVKGTTLEVYRAPSGSYREISHFECIISTTLGTASTQGLGNGVAWGITTRACSVASQTQWRRFAVLTTSDDGVVGWSFIRDTIPRRCHTNPLGIMAGFGVRWGGQFATEDDVWSLKTSALYAAKNIFRDSPSIQWRQPVDETGPASEQVFEWQLPDDSESHDMSMLPDGIAVFGRNWYGCKLEVATQGGTWTSVLDTNGSDLLHFRQFDNVTVHNNVLTLTVGTTDGNFPPGCFASTEWRKWYVKFLSGTLNGKVYRIVDNYTHQSAGNWRKATTHNLVLECNVESLGATSGSDDIIVFSDRFFFKFPNTLLPNVSERFRLTVYEEYASPSENQHRIGTVVLGRLVQLPDDEWSSDIRTDPNNSRQTGRSGLVSVWENGPPIKTIGLEYTGNRDAGMGITDASQFARMTGYGKLPLVWIDDDAALVANAHLCHNEPILVRLSGGESSRRESYFASSENQAGTTVTFKRNIMSVSGIILEEVV